MALARALAATRVSGACGTAVVAGAGAHTDAARRMAPTLARVARRLHGPRAIGAVLQAPPELPRGQVAAVSPPMTAWVQPRAAHLGTCVRDFASTASADSGESDATDSDETEAEMNADNVDAHSDLVGDALSRTQSEIHDSQLIFDQVWRHIERDMGGERSMTFPKEIIWLAGAPGAGKGTMSGFIREERGITAPPLECSKLFTGELAEKMKAEGRLLGDKEVVEAVFRKLLDPVFQTGVLVDGFPRTEVQAQCIRHLHERMGALYSKYLADPVLRAVFRRPVFHLCVLYVDEAESIRRQLYRGKKAGSQSHLRELGIDVEEERTTDNSEQLARERYRVFKDSVYPSLNAIRNKLHFHFVDASESKHEVKERIRAEFGYQSSLELGEDTFELMRGCKSAADMVKHARQSLVQRLNSYVRENRDLFMEVMHLLNSDFMHILERQALAGRAIIRSNSPLLENPVAVNMVLDILAERGYFVTLDVFRSQVPHLVEPPVPASTLPQRIRTRTMRTYLFDVTFDKPKIRRG